ncbi:MAG: alpha/beta fold hydrolase [Mycobacteriales bacterium]
MGRFGSYDGTLLAYREVGSGPPLVCVPGGPGRAGEYLGDLGGLSGTRTLLVLDNRGTGESAVPVDPDSYRMDRLVHDVEAFRAHLGLDAVDLLGHSAAGAVTTLYAATHPDRIARLVQVTPSTGAAGVRPTEEEYEAAIARRGGEPWFDEALPALWAWARAETYEETVRHRVAANPFFYGAWTEAARAHAAADPLQRSVPATIGFSEGPDPDTAMVRAALRGLEAPVLVLAGELDLSPTPAVAREYAAVFPHGELVVQPDAGHFPWVDDPAWFAAAVEDFLAST